MTGVALAVGLVAAVVWVAAIPLAIVVESEWSARIRTRWRMTWLYGLVDLDLTKERVRRRPARATPGAAADRPTSGAGRRRAGSAVLALARIEGLGDHVIACLKDVGRTARVDEIEVRAEFGLDDPADTGVLCGVLVPWCLAARAAGFDLRCRPRFLHPGFTGTARGRVRVRPIVTVGVLARYLCAPVTFRAVRAIRRAR